MSSQIGVPLSVVGADWIASELYPQLDRAVTQLPVGGILWLGVDSGREGNYLLQRISLFAHERGIPCHSVLVRDSDPYLLWSEIAGSSEEPSLLNGLAAPALVCVENAFSIPLSTLVNRAGWLAATARGYKLLLALPVSHEVRRRLEGSTHIDVPPFATVPELQRRELAALLLADVFPRDDQARRDRLAHDLIQAAPASRAELESWIDYFAGLDAPAVAAPWQLPPPIPRLPRSPIAIPTGTELQARLVAAMAHLREASAAFAAWRGEALIRTIREPSDPFAVHDPAHWFVACVTYLACHVFDAVHPCFLPLLGYRWNGATGELENAAPPRFIRNLRSLRTMFQHGLDDGEASSRETVNAVEAWYQGACGVGQPEREHYRLLTTKLLAEWQEVAQRVQAVVTNAGVSTNRALVEAQLDLAARRLPRYKWREYLEAARARLGVTAEIDLDRALDRHISTLQEVLLEAAHQGGALEDLAHRAAGDVIAAELARCPVSTDDLRAVGIPPGPSLGLARAFVEERWRADLTLDRDQLLALARRQFLT